MECRLGPEESKSPTSGAETRRALASAISMVRIESSLFYSTYDMSMQSKLHDFMRSRSSANLDATKTGRLPRSATLEKSGHTKKGILSCISRLHIGCVAHDTGTPKRKTETSHRTPPTLAQNMFSLSFTISRHVRSSQVVSPT